MRNRPDKVNQVLAKDRAAKEREGLMVYIVNIPLPGEDFWGRQSTDGGIFQQPGESELEDIRKSLEQEEFAPERRATLEQQFKETWPGAQPERIREMVEREISLSGANNPLLHQRALEEYWKRTPHQRVVPALSGWTAGEYKDQTLRLRKATEKFWPELWQPIENQNTTVEDRAWGIILKMRRYLRSFWSPENDKRTRYWYIHRAREYYERLRILPELLKVPESARPIEAELRLDQPPKLNPIEKALYELQKRAAKPKYAPRICPNDCERRYFLSTEKGHTYCPDCRRSEAQKKTRKRAQKLESYHRNKDKWPSTANRRKHRG